MKYTENYNLKKPEATDAYNVNDFNTNADTVDAELAKLKRLTEIEDISDAFIATIIADKSSYGANVKKQGNIISGSIRCSINPAYLDLSAGKFTGYIPLLEIADAYRPASSNYNPEIPLSAFGVDTNGDYVTDVIVFINLRGEIAAASAVKLQDIVFSFTYICE